MYNNVWVETYQVQPNQFIDGNFSQTIPQSPGWYAEIAAMISILPFNKLESFKWGFNFGSLLEEAIDRQKLFIESQHFPGELRQEPADQRAIAIRCTFQPGSNGLVISLIAKVQAANEFEARSRAQYYWDELNSIFPYDYTLLPATTKDEFLKLTRWDWLSEAIRPECLAEIERFEGILTTGKERLYLMGTWKNSMIGNEQFWRVLAGSNHRILLNIGLSPTITQEIDLNTINELIILAESLEKENLPASTKIYLKNAVENYRETLTSLHHPFYIRIHLISPDGIPEYLPRALGFAATHSTTENPPVMGFQVTIPENLNEIRQWQHVIKWLDLKHLIKESRDIRMTRIRRLVNAPQALTLFRLPYPPKNGIPGVSFTNLL